MHPSSIAHPVTELRRRQVLPTWVKRMDAVAARHINGRRVHRAVDRGYRNLSRAANRGVLWTGIAAVLALVGPRRAAARGLASLSVASIIANLIGKRVFGGDRPLLKDIPIGRRLHRSPTSGSFPSGHSASAAGFATGVALESPLTGAAIAPLAAGVAYSRLHTGAHWLSDVLGGVALGAGTAAAGKLLLPLRRRPAAVVPPTAHTVALPALPDGRGALIIVNAIAGASRGPDPARLIAERIPQATLRTLDEDEDLATVIRDALQNPPPGTGGPRALGIYGGDGSAATAARLAIGAGLPLLVLPGGTYNHFAATADLDSLDTALAALQSGQGRRVDVAELTLDEAEPLAVLNTASVGIYPAFVVQRERLQHRLGKRLAALIAAVRVLTAAEKIDLTVNGRPARVWSVFVGVNRYFPANAAPQQRRRLDDGLFDVRILHADAWARTSGVIALAFGRRASTLLQTLRPAASSIEAFTADAVEIVVRHHPGDTPGIAHDGEASVGGGDFTATLHMLPGALELYSPDD